MTSPNPLPTNRRIYGIVKAGTAGKMVLLLTASETPDMEGALGAFIWRGELMKVGEVMLDIVTDPALVPTKKGDQGNPGPNGWTPVLVGELDGTRTIMRVADWTGGKGDKPAVGYIGPSGSTALVAKAAAFNFNAAKRVGIFAGQSGTGGIAAIKFDPPFAAAPAVGLPQAVPNVLTGPVKAELVAGSLTKDGCQVKVTAAALVTGALSPLVGASVTVIAIDG